MRRKAGLSPIKALLVIVGGIWVFGLLTGLFVARPRPSAEPVYPAPLITEIQQLGQLHTVRYNMHDVLEHERHLEPKGWVKALPGAQSIYEATTSNKVTLVAAGGIEAGVDLSGIGPQSVTRISTPQGPRWRVRLPHATLYEPNIHVHVITHEAGAFWNDEDIVPQATEEAERRVREGAARTNIVATAETNAVKALSRLQVASGNPNVEFYF